MSTSRPAWPPGRRRNVVVAALAGLVAVGLAGCGSSPPPRPEPTGARLGSWADAGLVGEARGGHTASALADGTVLVAGGQVDADNTSKASVEIFDPATGRWKAATAMSAARSAHTATVMADGRVLVAGGIGLGSAELFDPTAGSWSPAGTMSTSRFAHTATLLPDGRVLAAGGFGAIDAPGLASAEVYDPAANSWSPAAPMTGGRGLHTATMLSDGRVLVAAGNDLGPSRRSPAEATSTTAAGGVRSTGRGEVATAELYDPASGTWTETGALQAGRSAHTATTLEDGRVLVVGGFSPDGELDSAELYDPAAGTWSPTAKLTSPRTIHVAALLADGTVLVAGGQLGSTGTLLSSTLPTAAVYDPDTAEWKRAADMATPRTAHSATVLANGKVLVVGGLNPAGPVASAELFSPEAGPGA